MGDKLKHVDLFAGIGGFSLGLEKTDKFETVAFCEIDKFAQKVLKKNWPDVPIAGDVTKLTYNNGALYDDGREIYRGTIDSFSCGFPCQDISVAGKQAGISEGTRSGLWSECARLLRQIKPRLMFAENTTNLLAGERGEWFKRVLWDISQVGYDAEWHCIPASSRAVDAPHQRDRVWIIAYPQGERIQGLWRSGQQEPHAHDKPFLSLCSGQRPKPAKWEIEPSLGRVVDGIPDRAHRIKCLGNSVVPKIPEILGNIYGGAE